MTRQTLQSRSITSPDSKRENRCLGSLLTAFCTAPEQLFLQEKKEGVNIAENLPRLLHQDLELHRSGCLLSFPAYLNLSQTGKELR